MLPPMTKEPVSPMRVTAKRFVECAWQINLGIISADSSNLCPNFIAEVSELALLDGVDVQYLNFAEYNNPTEALTARENASFANAIAIEDSSKPRLLWFDNCDSLSPLSEDLTYSIRSVLTTRYDGMVQAVFIARPDSLKLLFSDRRAAFYRSDFKITDFSII